MKRMGIEFTFVAPNCSDEELEAAFRPNTKCVFGETVANPALVVLDIDDVLLLAICTLDRDVCISNTDYFFEVVFAGYIHD